MQAGYPSLSGVHDQHLPCLTFINQWRFILLRLILGRIMSLLVLFLFDLTLELPSMLSVITDTLDGQSLAVHDMFKMIDEDLRGELNIQQIQAAHEMIRMGGISIPQVSPTCCLFI